MSNQLLPCPFCGHDEPTHDEGDDSAWVQCTNGECGMCGPMASGPSLAAAAWNRRATQPAAGEPIGKVELFGINMTYVEWRDRKMPPLGTELYAAPPAAAHGDDTRRIDWLACTWRLGGKLPDVDHGSFREVIDVAMRAQGEGGEV